MSWERKRCCKVILFHKYATLTVKSCQQMKATLNKSFLIRETQRLTKDQTHSLSYCLSRMRHEVPSHLPSTLQEKHVIYMEMEYGKGNVSNIVFSSPRSTYEKAARQKSILAPAAAMLAVHRGRRSHQQYGSAEVNPLAAVICLKKLQAVANKALSTASTPPPSTFTQNYNHTINLKRKTTATRSKSRYLVYCHWTFIIVIYATREVICF